MFLADKDLLFTAVENERETGKTTTKEVFRMHARFWNGVFLQLNLSPLTVSNLSRVEGPGLNQLLGMSLMFETDDVKGQTADDFDDN